MARHLQQIADYEALRTGKLKLVLVKEIVRPSGKFCYPLAAAKLDAIKSFKPLKDVVLPPSASFAPPPLAGSPAPPSIDVEQGGRIPEREPPGLERVKDGSRAAKITQAR